MHIPRSNCSNLHEFTRRGKDNTVWRACLLLSSAGPSIIVFYIVRFCIIYVLIQLVSCMPATCVRLQCHLAHNNTNRNFTTLLKMLELIGGEQLARDAVWLSHNHPVVLPRHIQKECAREPRIPGHSGIRRVTYFLFPPIIRISYRYAILCLLSNALTM